MTINGEELYPEESRSLDSLRQMRLVALLRDMIEAGGWVKTAETLGVSYRTVVRAEESGRLTGRMGHALERHLLLGGGSAAAPQRERGDAGGAGRGDAAGGAAAGPVGSGPGAQDGTERASHLWETRCDVMGVYRDLRQLQEGKSGRIATWNRGERGE